MIFHVTKIKLSVYSEIQGFFLNFIAFAGFFYTKFKLLKLIKTMLDVIIDELIKVIVIMNCLQAPM